MVVLRLVLSLEQARWRVGSGPRGLWGLWLESPGGPGSSACALVYGAGSWALWWAGLCPGAAVDSGGLKAACLLMGGAVCMPT